MWMLEVLPGWPEAEPASNLFLFLLMIGAPIATGLLITVLCWAPKIARREDTGGSTSPEITR